MVRCPACGIRLEDKTPLCPDHGAPLAREPPPDAKVSFPIDPPDVAGYTLSQLLGVGGFGAVFRAERRSDGADVAIKVARLDQISASGRLRLEAEALRALGPPHVPAVFEVGALASGAAFMVLEFVKAP